MPKVNDPLKFRGSFGICALPLTSNLTPQPENPLLSHALPSPRRPPSSPESDLFLALWNGGRAQLIREVPRLRGVQAYWEVAFNLIPKGVPLDLLDLATL